mmetsp:Transcript_5487/g.9001  ORF Transcript_5487/g.9001 Transcript_5487/m.9001 type:complete len:92 (+) Transcript_5487:111-386(+)
MDPRNDRLKIRKTNEEVLRKKLELEAHEYCRKEITAFGDCAKNNGLLVVFNCRKENMAMGSCIDSQCTEQKFDAFLIRQGIEPSTIQRTKK